MAVVCSERVDYFSTDTWERAGRLELGSQVIYARPTCCVHGAAPSGGPLLVIGNATAIGLWDLDAGACVGELTGPGSRLAGMDCLPPVAGAGGASTAPDQVVTVWQNGSLCAWDIRTREVVVSAELGKSRYSRVWALPDGGRVITCDYHTNRYKVVRFE